MPPLLVPFWFLGCQGLSGSTEQAGRDQGQSLGVAASSPTVVIPLSPFSSCQSHPQPSHFQL